MSSPAPSLQVLAGAVDEDDGVAHHRPAADIAVVFVHHFEDHTAAAEILVLVLGNLVDQNHLPFLCSADQTASNQSHLRRHHPCAEICTLQV